MTDPTFHADDRVALYAGDCFDMFADLDDCSVDAVVCDPPYDLTANKRGGAGAASVDLESPYGRSRIGTGNGGGGFMGKDWDATGIAFTPKVWAECLRVLKPGGHLLAFGGTRTWHRMATAIEDAGFEVRDSMAWLYGSGFPKSMDVSKAIDKAAGATRKVISEGSPVKRMIPGADQNATGSWIKDNGREFVPTETAPATDAAKQWQGWGTALKPAFEPIVVARKPLGAKTVAANVLEYGTGALNIDATRVQYASAADMDQARVPQPVQQNDGHAVYQMGTGQGRNGEMFDPSKGRWPTNVLLDGDMADQLDEQVPTAGGGYGVRGRGGSTYANGEGFANTLAETGQVVGYGDTGGASRFFPVFRYQAKAPAKERPKVEGVAHPTVKPLALIEWLITLVVPQDPDAIVLDPFAGSGTTVEAALRRGVRCIASEREETYVPLIMERITRCEQETAR